MIEKRVPKDVRSYKMKTCAGLCTVRQLLFTIGAAGCAAICYLFVLRPLGIRDYQLIFIASMICGLPCLAFGWFEPMGVPLEKWVVFAIRFWLAPPNRVERQKYITTGDTQKKRKKKKPITKKELMQHPEYRGYR